MALKQRVASRPPASSEPPQRKHRLRRKILLVLVLALFVFGLFLSVVYLFTKIPKPSEVATIQSTVVEDAGGRLVGRLHAGEDRVLIPLTQMAPVMQKAIVAAEDRDFYHHHGLSLAGIVRAAFTDVISGRVRAGGSTITQQYVKNAFVGRERTITRKIREALIAVKLERSWSKTQILEAYLNTIYFGRGAYGIEAAARAFFGVGASKLDLPQAALLAGVVRAPELLDPLRHHETATKARNRVLKAMVETNVITQQEADAAAAIEVSVLPRRLGVTGRAPHFLEAVRLELVDRFGEDAVYRGGLKVRTTLDVRMQQAAEDAVSGVLDRASDPQAALVAVDPATGGVRALVGGRTFESSQFNMATQALRQPGSSFKPFVLASFLQQGGTLNDHFRAPARISLDAGGFKWNVGNYDKRDYGTLSVLSATEHSVNTVYAQMILRVGPPSVIDIAHSLGISAKLEPVASLALGTEEVTPLEMASAYASLADDGKHVPVHLIASVTDRSGKSIYRFKDRATQQLPQRIARTVTQALQGVMHDGTGQSADFGRPAAGKTGTTENHRDAWFAGYTPDLAATVWMGYPDGQRTMNNVRGIQVVGASFPARMWKRFMAKALDGVQPRDFPVPEAAPAPSPNGSLSPAPTFSGTVVPTGTIPAPGATSKPQPVPKPTHPPQPPSSSQPTPEPTPTASPTHGGESVPPSSAPYPAPPD